MLILMDKSTHEENLTQSIQTNRKQYKSEVTFLTGHDGIFNATSNNIKFYFATSNFDKDGFTQLTPPPGAYG